MACIIKILRSSQQHLFQHNKMLTFKRTFKLYGAEIRVHEIRYGSKFGQFGPQSFLTFFFLTDAPPKYETLFGNQVSMLLKFSSVTCASLKRIRAGTICSEWDFMLLICTLVKNNFKLQKSYNCIWKLS